LEPRAPEDLADVLLRHLGITVRRLEKSGPTHFARSRFDAIWFVVRNWRTTPIEDRYKPELEKRFQVLQDAIDELISRYPELDPMAYPPIQRSRNRTEMLIDEMLEEAGTRRRGELFEAPTYGSVGVNSELNPMQPSASSHPIRLSGSF
jgi:hypothetical protein